MSPESEEMFEQRMERIQRRAENFRELLKEGEEVTIAYFDGEVTIEESARSRIERKHAKLFGRMLSMEAQMETSRVPYFCGLVAAGVMLIGLQLGWWEPLLGKELNDMLNSWWFTLVLIASSVYLVSVGCGLWRRQAYRRQRQGLLELMAQDKLDRDLMLVMLRDVDELANVVQELKLDNGPFPQAPG